MKNIFVAISFIMSSILYVNAQSADKQIELVESICETLNVTPENVEDIFSQHITPYCVLEFESPCWQDIASFLHTKYAFNPPRLGGELMTPERYENIPLVPKSRSLTPLPLAASLKKYCPIPGHQGKYATCTGWATSYAARTISWAVKKNLTNVHDITKQAFSPSFVFALIKSSNNVNCLNGAYIDQGVKAMKETGNIFHVNLPMPYQCNPDITSFLQDAKLYAIKDYKRLTANSGINSQEDFDNIKWALAEKKPVIGQIKNYLSFINSEGCKIWNGVCDEMDGYHAVCIIGYDDNFDNGDGTFGAVELINSWGTTWGNGGFIYIKYQDFLKIFSCGVSLSDSR